MKQIRYAWRYAILIISLIRMQIYNTNFFFIIIDRKFIPSLMFRLRDKAGQNITSPGRYNSEPLRQMVI